MFSILIPTFNNLDYLKICLNSLRKNSAYEHQIIIHLNEGSDGSLDYVKSQNLEFTYSRVNIGMPKALNKSSKLSIKEYILISHDDFYFCPGWDKYLVNEIKLIKNNRFYLSGTMIETDKIDIDVGNTYLNFNEQKLVSNLDKLIKNDFQGSTKCPGLIHKELWNEVGGWSEEYSPTGGDDSDFAMKLWKSNVRIFKGLQHSKVYHFGSITTRKKDKNLNTYLGSRGNKIFLKKWGISINFFENKFLKTKQKYDGILKSPNKNFSFFINLIYDKLNLLYLIIFFRS